MSRPMSLSGRAGWLTRRDAESALNKATADYLSTIRCHLLLTYRAASEPSQLRVEASVEAGTAASPGVVAEDRMLCSRIGGGVCPEPVVSTLLITNEDRR